MASCSTGFRWTHRSPTPSTQRLKSLSHPSCFSLGRWSDATPDIFSSAPLNPSCEIHDRFRHGSSEFWSWVGEPYAFVHVHGRLRLCLWYLREYGAWPCLLSVLWQQWAVVIFIFCCCSRHTSLYTLVHYVVPLFILWCGTDSVLEDKPVQA